jgi:leucyl/phenylalanyl-tRNA--protein transferase
VSRDRNVTELSPDLLLRAYAAGIFPMAEAHDDDQIFWVDPEERGILPLDRYHIPRSLKKEVRKQRFDVRFDSAFEQVLDLCAEQTTDRSNTWINTPIRNAVVSLHDMGFAHSVETWVDDELVGGLYGIALGSAFFGESMFSRRTNASKVALVHLLAILQVGHFQLLDTQFVTDHLITFGAIEIPSEDYLARLELALNYQSQFHNEISKIQLGKAVENVLINSVSRVSE